MVLGEVGLRTAAEKILRQLGELREALEDLREDGDLLGTEYSSIARGLVAHLRQCGRSLARGRREVESARMAAALYGKLCHAWVENRESGIPVGRVTPAEDAGVIRACGRTIEMAQGFYLRRFFGSDHAFLVACEKHSYDELDHHLIETVRRDLTNLQTVAEADWGGWMSLLYPDFEDASASEDLPFSRTRQLQRENRHSKRRIAPAPLLPWDVTTAWNALIEAFRFEEDWSELAHDVASFVYEHGHGPRRGCPAFVLTREGELLPVREFDYFPLEWLQGNAERIEIIERNTGSLLQRFPSNNVLIWGPRGCGKSSLIRGLIGRYYSEGLRGIEIAPEAYDRIPDLFRLVRDRRECFVGVLDNVSMTPRDPAVHALARALDGCLEKMPPNLVFYATSNYKDLVDREGERTEGLMRMQMDAVEASADGESTLVNQGKRPESYDPSNLSALMSKGASMTGSVSKSLWTCRPNRSTRSWLSRMRSELELTWMSRPCLLNSTSGECATITIWWGGVLHETSSFLLYLITETLTRGQTRAGPRQPVPQSSEVRCPSLPVTIPNSRPWSKRRIFVRSDDTWTTTSG